MYYYAIYWNVWGFHIRADKFTSTCGLARSRGVIVLGHHGSDNYLYQCLKWGHVAFTSWYQYNTQYNIFEYNTFQIKYLSSRGKWVKLHLAIPALNDTVIWIQNDAENVKMISEWTYKDICWVMGKTHGSHLVILNYNHIEMGSVIPVVTEIQ